MIWLNLAIIILVIIGAIMIVFYLNRKWLIRDIETLLNKGVKLLKENHQFSKENAFILDRECQEITKLLMKIEQVLRDPPANIKLNEFYQQSDENYTRLLNIIQEKRRQWTIYMDFKSNIPFLQQNIEQQITLIKLRGEKLILENPEQAAKINEVIEQEILEGQELVNEYRALDKAGFKDFNFYILKDLEQQYAQVMNAIDNFLQALSFFYRKFTISLVGLVRSSNFYLTLEAEDSGSRRKKLYKEILVSFRAYDEHYPGKEYDRENIVAKKRIVSQQKVQLDFQIDEHQYSWEQELTDEEFKEIFQELEIPYSKGEPEEEGIPLEINKRNLNIPLCSKEVETLTIEYFSEFFQGINVFLLLDRLLQIQEGGITNIED